MLLFVVLGRFGVLGLETLGARRGALLVLEGAMVGWWDLVELRIRVENRTMRNGGVREGTIICGNGRLVGRRSSD